MTLKWATFKTKSVFNELLFSCMDIFLLTYLIDCIQIYFKNGKYSKIVLLPKNVYINFIEIIHKAHAPYMFDVWW